MLSFSRVQLRLLMAAGFLLALSAAIQFAGARLAPPLVLVQAGESQNQGGEDPATVVRATQDATKGDDPANADTTEGSSDRIERDLNRMSFEDLIELPGIGPVIAQRILDYRAQYGPFVRLEQLLEIPGIGRVRFDQLLPFVTIGPPPELEGRPEQPVERGLTSGEEDVERQSGTTL